jgi:hypothetical protein
MRAAKEFKMHGRCDPHSLHTNNATHNLCANRRVREGQSSLPYASLRVTSLTNAEK